MNSVQNEQRKISKNLKLHAEKGLEFISYSDGVAIVKKEDKLFLAILNNYHVIKLYSAHKSKILKCFTMYLLDYIDEVEHPIVNLDILEIGD